MKASTNQEKLVQARTTLTINCAVMCAVVASFIPISKPPHDWKFWVMGTALIAIFTVNLILVISWYKLKKTVKLENAQ